MSFGVRDLIKIGYSNEKNLSSLFTLIKYPSFHVRQTL